jgi:SAM-dependent methyltransferase
LRCECREECHLKSYQEELPDVTRYIANNSHLGLDDHEEEFEKYLRLIRRCHAVDATTRMLEIGTGTGWFPLLCKRHGLSCKGLEISPQLIDYARQFGRSHGIEAEIDLGNAEDTDLGIQTYDVILAQSVFEHIEHWERAAERIYRALKPGGLFVFSSTNKFAFTSGEYNFPLYSWLPDSWRYRLRVARQGPDIMKLGIDFNQFCYPLLRRTFQRIGFSQVLDRVELSRPAEVSTPLRRLLVRTARHSRLVKALVLTFADATIFLCVK